MPLPPDISAGFATLLVITSFATSALTAALGLGGGVALLAVMATGLPVSTLIPVHGVVQFGSNAGRALVQRRHILWRLVFWMGVGMVIGSAIGGLTVTSLPDRPLKIAIGLFILYMTWGPKSPGFGIARWPLIAGGTASSALTMFFGATGPFVSALLAAGSLDRLALVATFSACMTVQHIMKLFTFGLLGFSFAPWLALIAAMIASGFAGTLVGSWLLHRMPEQAFKHGLRIIITVLAVHLIASASGVTLF